VLSPFSMNVGLMIQHIEFCAACLMVSLQQPHMNGMTNPFP
jgi:hypothetical protein